MQPMAQPAAPAAGAPLSFDDALAAFLSSLSPVGAARGAPDPGGRVQTAPGEAPAPAGEFSGARQPQGPNAAQRPNLGPLETLAQIGAAAVAGRGFPEMVAQNPQGWGNAPPPGLPGKEASQGIPDFSDAPTFGERGFAEGAKVLASEAAPDLAGLVLGPAGRAVSAAPKTLAGLVAGTGLFGGMSDAGEAQSGAAQKKKPGFLPISDMPGLSPEQNTRRRDLMTKLATEGFIPRVEREELGQINKLSTDYSTEQNRLNAQGQADADRIKREEDARKVSDAEVARNKVLGESRKPFEEQFPNWASMQFVLPLAAGAATGGAVGLRGAMAERGALQRWNSALDGATKPGASLADIAKSATIAKDYDKNWKSGMRKQAGAYGLPTGLGAAEGAALSNLPEVYNVFLPAENPEHLALQEYIKRLPEGHPEAARAKAALAQISKTNPSRDAAIDYFRKGDFGPRMAIGAVEGAAGGAAGTTVGKLPGPVERDLPRSETAALAKSAGSRGRRHHSMRQPRDDRGRWSAP